MGLSIKQRVKVNAALAMIHANGYDAQAVVNWAREYERSGHDARRAFETALNEFAAGQPAMGNQLGKITRLVEASSVATVAAYDQALSAYIATGDSSGIDALAPMIAADSVALAVRNGELADGGITEATLEAALGFPMEVPQAAPAVPAAADQTASQVSPYSGAQAGGRVAQGDRWNSAPVQQDHAPRGLLAGFRMGGEVGLGDTPAAQGPQSRAQIQANHASQGVQAHTI